MITIEQVYRAMGIGFPEGATCHVGVVIDEEKSLPAVNHYGTVYILCDGEWLIDVDVAILGGDIGPEPARPFVPVFKHPGFTATLERLEAEEKPDTRRGKADTAAAIRVARKVMEHCSQRDLDFHYIETEDGWEWAGLRFTAFDISYTWPKLWEKYAREDCNG